MRLGVVMLVLGACAPPHGGKSTPGWVSETAAYQSSPAVVAAPIETTPTISAIEARYATIATRILTAARADRGAYDKLAYLADHIGHRLSGSASLDRAIAWAAKTLAADGHEVRTERVMVPHWVRGHEEASVTAPVERPLRILGLGGSVATPKAGLAARVVVIRSWDELAVRAAEVKGAIVLYDVAMPAWDPVKGSGYGDVAPYRTRGASRAAKLGAVGVLVRSATAHSLRTPHTGRVSYEADQPKIPAAAITVEDALFLGRLAAQGPVTVRLKLASRQLPDAPSANVIGELRGTARPEEIVLIGAHLDSWDVGQGAHDDGAGCVMMMQALTVIRKLGLAPRRTIRVVLFTNEENGLRGGEAYAKDHAGELANTVLAVEADAGGFAPRGFTVETLQPASRVLARIAEIGALLRPLGTLQVITGGSGADLAPLILSGVPGVGLITDTRTYFDIHHTEADTLDKVDPAALADNVAAIAVLAFVVADLPERLDAASDPSSAPPAPAATKP